MRKKKVSLGATPRGNCTVCNHRFADATDREYQQRWDYHVTMSVRHQKYLALQAPLPFVVLPRSQKEKPACQ
jgi:hypothetical protein